MKVRTAIEAGVAVVTIDNPPVNAVSAEVRQGLVEAMDAAESAAVSRIVITSAGRIFAAGADAREFDLAPIPPHLPDVLARELTG